jgi:hypothetical protein
MKSEDLLQKAAKEFRFSVYEAASMVPSFKG